jgi:hypothetical protein
MSEAQAPTQLNVYPPSEASMKGAYISGMAAYQKLCAEAAADFEGYLGAPRARVPALEEALHEGAGPESRPRSSAGSRTAS